MIGAEGLWWLPPPTHRHDANIREKKARRGVRASARAWKKPL